MFAAAPLFWFAIRKSRAFDTEGAALIVGFEKPNERKKSHKPKRLNVKNRMDR